VNSATCGKIKNTPRCLIVNRLKENLWKR